MIAVMTVFYASFTKLCSLVAVEIVELNGSFGQAVYLFLSSLGLYHVTLLSVRLSAIKKLFDVETFKVLYT